MPRMLKEFRQFILRGNLVDLAVAVVIGAAFTSVVNALVKGLVTPLIAAVGGQPDFAKLVFTINGSRFAYGEFLNALIAFLIVAAVMFFLDIGPSTCCSSACIPNARSTRRPASAPNASPTSRPPLGAARSASEVVAA